IAIVAAATLTTSASVATAGIIGWVGLVVPHLSRSLVGPDFARLLPTAAILGGGYLLLIDTLARTAAEGEISLGILTAVIGTPFFIWLLASMQRTWSGISKAKTSPSAIQTARSAVGWTLFFQRVRCWRCSGRTAVARLPYSRLCLAYLGRRRGRCGSGTSR